MNATTLTRRQFAAGLTALGGAGLLAACSGGSDAGSQAASTDAADSDDLGLVTEGKLTIVDEYGFAPFDYMDEATNEPVGFDIDVAKAIAEKLGLEPEFLPNQKFDTLVPIIKQGGKADISIAAITITDERAAEIDFSDPYIDSNQGVIARSGSGETVDSLNDPSKTVSAQGGTTGEAWAIENLPDATILPLDDVAAGLAGVQTGLYDGYVVDLPVAQNLISETYTDLEVIEEVPTGEQYGIAISKDNPALLAAVNDALAQMQSDGTMDEIMVKWFGEAI